MPKNIVLVGYMASGKSRIGWELTSGCGRYLGLELLDTDKYIEEKMNCSISEMFAEKGEQFFRDKETETLKELAMHRGFVISTGGGMPVRDENRQLLKELGLVVYLRASVETTVKRVRGDSSRPLLQGEEPLENKIKRMIDERRPVYESVADMVVDVDDRTPEDIAQEILKSFE